MPSHAEPGRMGRRPQAVFILAAIVALAAASISRPWLLANTTVSEPRGVYVDVFGPPSVGRLIAFHAPPAAFPYADRRLGYLHHVPILKTIAAGPGDLVCADGRRLSINGQDRAPVAGADEEGRALPHWIGCRRMSAGELFVFSDHVPNSFDSRYFGPVAQTAVLGVYAPLLTLPERR